MCSKMNNRPPAPPGFALLFLWWFCRNEFLEEIEGNLIELYEKEYEQAALRAKRAFCFQVLWHFRPDFIRSFHPINYSGMFRHNLTIAYRNILRHKSVFFINLIGLSTGLACALLIFFWVSDEWKTDRFHENGDRLYQVMNTISFAQGNRTVGNTPIPLATDLEEEMPEVEKAVAVNDFFTYQNKEGLVAVGGKIMAVRSWHAEPGFSTSLPSH